MARYFLELSYKGTDYSGFQVQDNARTIQGEVEKALKTYYRADFILTGSSRTDAGVHACQNFFHFDTALPVEPRNCYNLNALLPADISIKGLYPVPDTAHARFDAESREYHYFIYREKNPFLTDRGWLYPYPVNIEWLQQAAAIVKEYQDFTSFSKRNTQVKTYLCDIQVSEWQERVDGTLVYTVKANRFLRGMVRGLVGTMLKMGKAQTGHTGFRTIIEAKDCTLADFTTPPQGLFLKQVIYNDLLKPFLKS